VGSDRSEDSRSRQPRHPPERATSLADYVLAIAPAIPDLLVPGPALARIVATARGLPPCAVAAFERPLGVAEPTVDFAVYLPRTEQAFRVLAEGEPDVLPRALLSAAGDGGPLVGLADRFWLEFDTGREVPTPSVFFSPAADLPLGDTVTAAITALTGGRLDAGLRSALDRYAALVAPARIFQVGAMLARPDAGLRLCTSRLGPHGLRRVLAAFGWSGDPECLMASYLPLLRGFPEVSVAVDLTRTGIGSRVGLELPLYVAGEDQQRAAWSPALEALQAAGYCSAEERAALLAWIGCTTPGSGPWPQNLAGVGAVMAWAQPCFERGLHHVKLVVDDDRFVGAKAYFGFAQSWTVRGET